MLVMSVAVSGTYLPLKSSGFPPDAHPALLGLDFLNLHIRRLRYAQEALFGPQGYLPGWYSRELGGTPFWSNIQNFPLIPTRLTALLLAKPEDAFGLAVQLSAVLAAIFMFLYCRRLAIGAVGSAMAGFTFACSGFFASRVYAGHLPLLEAYLALPLLLWIIELNIASEWPQRPPPLKLLAAAFASFSVTVAGHPQLPLYAFTIATLYLLFRARDRNGLMVGAAMLLGVGAASFVLYPMLLLIGRSTRVLSLDPPVNDVAFPYGRIATFLLPNLHGTLPPDFHGYPDAGYFWDTVCYVGLLPIVACVALLVRWIVFGHRSRGVWIFLAVAGVLSLALALPAWQSLLPQIPGFSLRSPSRQIYITTFALAIAAGVGVDLALAHVQSRHVRGGYLALAVLIAAHAWDLGWHHDRTFVAAVAMPDPGDKRGEETLIRDLGQQRIAIGYDITKVYNRQIDDIGVFDSILLARPYRALMDVANAPPKLNVQNIDGSQVSARANQFFGVGLMLTHTRRPDLQQLALRDQLFLYRVPDPIPRASLVPVDHTQFLNDDETHRRLRDQSFDLSRRLLVPEDTPRPPAGVPPTGLAGLNLKRPSTDQIRVEVTAPWPGYLRLLETWDPGWTAKVDGTPAPVARAYDAFMAIPVPAGRYTVDLTYHTPGAPAGAMLSLVSLAGLAGLLWMSWRPREEVEAPRKSTGSGETASNQRRQSRRRKRTPAT